MRGILFDGRQQNVYVEGGNQDKFYAGYNYGSESSDSRRKLKIGLIVSGVILFVAAATVIPSVLLTQNKRGGKVKSQVIVPMSFTNTTDAVRTDKNANKTRAARCTIEDQYNATNVDKKARDNENRKELYCRINATDNWTSIDYLKLHIQRLNSSIFSASGNEEKFCTLILLMDQLDPFNFKVLPAYGFQNAQLLNSHYSEFENQQDNEEPAYSDKHIDDNYLRMDESIQTHHDVKDKVICNFYNSIISYFKRMKPIAWVRLTQPCLQYVDGGCLNLTMEQLVYSYMNLKDSMNSDEKIISLANVFGL